MRQFEPGTNIIGCVRRVDRHGFPAVDLRGNAIFHMPKPIYYQQHKGNQTHTQIVVDDDGTARKTIRVIKSPQVPIYRGISASLARYMRGQARRAQRKQMAESIALDDERREALKIAERKAVKEPKSMQERFEDLHEEKSGGE